MEQTLLPCPGRELLFVSNTYQIGSIINLGKEPLLNLGNHLIDGSNVIAGHGLSAEASGQGWERVVLLPLH